MERSISFTGEVQKFPGAGGWHYVAVPKKYTRELTKMRAAWGMYPITATVGSATWNTKIMMKKGGDYFIALKKSVRTKESIDIGDRISVSFNIR